jgi:putative oxidoreductase
LREITQVNSLQLMKFGPLPIRILVGVTLIAHGLPKFYDMPGTQGFFGSLGLPGELAVAIALLEVVVGIVIIVGLLTRIAAGLVVLEMMESPYMSKFQRDLSEVMN